MQEYILLVEKQFLEGKTNPFNELCADIATKTGEILEITKKIGENQFSLILRNQNGYLTDSRCYAETLEELFDTFYKYENEKGKISNIH